MQSAQTQWLGATATHSRDKDMPTLVDSLSALVLHYPQLHMVVNFFDHEPVNPSQLLRTHARNQSALAQLEGTAVAGMKTLFWYRYLTPARTRHLKAVWVFDCDIAVHPSVFPLGQLAGVMAATRATVLQPSIQALVHGTYHPWLRVRKAHMSCLATTAQWVEMQTPLFAGDAWARFHEKVLSIIPEKGLATSDFGLDIIWCAFLKDEFPTRPACLVTPSASATHLNSHAIENFMSKEVMKQVRSCSTTCTVLFERFKSYWKNFSHHTGECYSVKGHAGLMAAGSHYAISGDGTIRARHGGHRQVGLTTGMSTEMKDEDSDAALAQVVRNLPRGVGAVSLDAKDRRVSLLALSLTKLCNAMPGLKIVVNLLEKEGSKGRTGRHQDVSQDDRIMTTYIRGPRALFWKHVLTPGFLADPIDYVWLLDPSLAAHPAANPLPQLLNVMRTTEAYLVYSRPHSSTLGHKVKAFSPGAAENPGCAASTVRYAPLALSTVIRADAWKLIHANVLSRIDETQLGKVEAGFEMLLCGVIYRRWGDTRRPTCVESHLLSSRLSEGREQFDLSVPVGGCEAEKCQAPLRKLFPLTFNGSLHDDGRCWVPGPKGLVMTRWARKPPIKKKPGGG